jgi:glycosyltransferase involved in cell wall biosynthesis
LNILINAVSARLGGGQTYVKQLLGRLPAVEDLTAYLVAPVSLAAPDKANLVRVDIPEYVVTSLWKRAFWEKFKLPELIRQNNIDVLFCPGGLLNGVKPGNCKTAVTFQNMLPFDSVQVEKYGFSYPGIRNRLLKLKLFSSMKKADLVIFISKYARDYITEIAGNRLGNTVLIPHGIDTVFRKASDASRALPAWLKDFDYMLYVSPLDVYKAQLEVIRAYSILVERKIQLPKLLLVGSALNQTYSAKVLESITTLGLKDKVIFKGHVEHAELPVVYQNAVINIFASETENCPYILLEALAAGRPLVSSGRPPMPEFAGEAAVYFDPASPVELADKLQELLENQALMERMAKLSLVKSFQYDWNESADRTWEALMALGAQK